MKDRFIRMKELVKITGMCRATIYNRLDNKSKYYDATFPKSIRIGQGTSGIVAWSENEINAWMESKIAAR